MAYYNPSFGLPIGAFTPIPPGVIPPPPTNYYGPGQIRFIGDDLPSVDPFNYPGIVHFGPSYTIIGPHLPDILPDNGVFDPNLVLPDGLITFHVPLQNPYIHIPM